jgi:hypothetical protein
LAGNINFEYERRDGAEIKEDTGSKGKEESGSATSVAMSREGGEESRINFLFLIKSATNLPNK